MCKRSPSRKGSTYRNSIRSLDKLQYASKFYFARQPRSISNRCVEIGCGLGDIIRNVSYEQAFGFDLDEKELNAARFLSRLNKQDGPTYEVFQFP